MAGKRKKAAAAGIGIGGIQRTGPKRVLKAVEKMMVHLTAYQSKNLEAMVGNAVDPIMGVLGDFIRRMEKLEKRVAWATRPGRRGPGRPPKKRGPGRPPKKRGPGRPPKKRGPGRPPKKRGPGRPPNKRGPGRPPNKRGPGRPPNKRGPGRPPKKRGPGRPPKGG